MRIALLSAVAVAGFVLAAQAADIRRIEAVGVEPIVAGKRSRVGPKEAAIDAALREAVYRVARDFLIESVDPSNFDGSPAAGAADDPELANLRPVLGDDMVRYTRSFKILQDRGEVPAMFAETPGAATEYVVIVEVQVDAGRVEQRLADNGLIARSERGGSEQVVKLEVMGLSHYAAYEALRALLIEQLGAASVSPLELERGRSVLAVQTSLEPAELLHRLLAASPPNLELSPLAAEWGAVRLSARWTPPPDAGDGADGSAAAAPGGGPSRGR